MKKTPKKAYTKPALLKNAKRIASAGTCCGMSASPTCGINRSKVA